MEKIKKSDPHIINIVGDTHNIESLKNVLLKFNNIISLGDIGATVSKDIFLDNNLSRYRVAWKFYSKKTSSIDKMDVEWFRRINIDGWTEQIDNIKNLGKEFTLIMGNSDLAMIDFFPECKNYLTDNIDSKFNFINHPEIKTFNNIQIIFLPFQREKYDLTMITERIDKTKKLFILTHCPAFENARKEYYVHLYNGVKQLSKKFPDKIVFFHGHMHPSFSYRYFLKSLPNIIFYCPKAEENFEGFGINNQVIRLNTRSGIFTIIDSITDKEVEFQDLPENYLHNEDHWNEFDENGNNPNKRENFT